MLNKLLKIIPAIVVMAAIIALCIVPAYAAISSYPTYSVSSFLAPAGHHANATITVTNATGYSYYAYASITTNKDFEFIRQSGSGNASYSTIYAEVDATSPPIILATDGYLYNVVGP